jgi:hypothetical protein
MILYLKQQQKSELSFFLKTKGKKPKGSIVNYRSFAITSCYHYIGSNEYDHLQEKNKKRLILVAIERPANYQYIALSVYLLSETFWWGDLEVGVKLCLSESVHFC